jgi:hypothetical protein
MGVGGSGSGGRDRVGRYICNVCVPQCLCTGADQCLLSQIGWRIIRFYRVKFLLNYVPSRYIV